MIVYVETNFVLEVAFAQEQSGSCQDILSLAESGAVDLAIPAFSIAEAYETQNRRRRLRNDLCNEIERELRLLSRSEQYFEVASSGGEVSTQLRQSADDDRERLDAVLARVLECAISVPVGVEVLRSAIELQVSFGLKRADSIIYTSVLNHMSSASMETKCFLNKNSRDFNTPNIREQLRAHNCRLISSFSDGLRFIQSSLG